MIDICKSKILTATQCKQKWGATMHDATHRITWCCVYNCKVYVAPRHQHTHTVAPYMKRRNPQSPTQWTAALTQNLL